MLANGASRVPSAPTRMHPLPEHLLARPVADLVAVEDARGPLYAVIASLALGGAERIVLEWAAEAQRRGRPVELAVLNRAGIEWQVPQGLTVLHRGERGPADFIADLAARWRAARVPVAAHLLRDALLAQFHRHGIATVPVLHNARAGWLGDPAAWPADKVPGVVACAEAVAAQAREAGCRLPLSVIRHRPLLDAQAFSSSARDNLRGRLGVDSQTLLIGMVGALKPQKNYPRALRVLKHLLGRRRAALAILGGVGSEAGMEELRALARLAEESQLTPHVKLPGFVSPVAPWLAAFDVLLNTSDYEGYSIATQEALAAGLPVLASAVSGQVEDPQPGLQLLPADARLDDWADALALLPVRGEPVAREARMRAPYLWSLALAAYTPGAGPRLQTLFVTANLNAGGAQRSLINLVTRIAPRHALEVAVCGASTHDYFPAALRAAGVRHWHPCDSSDAFEVAESLLAWSARRGVGQLCFWNADPKLKLLIAKFAPPALRLLDVSPGAYAFEEMAATGEFQGAVVYTQQEFQERLDVLVLKYGVPIAGRARRCVVIPNGVALAPTRTDQPPVLTAADLAPALVGADLAPAPAVTVQTAAPTGTEQKSAPRFLVSGRIAPSKHLEQIIAAFHQVRARWPESVLHIVGQAEPRHASYLAGLTRLAGDGVAFRGAQPDLAHLRAAWSAQIVIGTHQGSPNAVLEAMAAGVPVIANDSGGTAELVRQGDTGYLLPEAAATPQIAAAMLEAAAHPGEARRRAGRAHALVAGCGIEAMARAYLALLDPGGATIPG